jgi:hypothetical protein
MTLAITSPINGVVGAGVSGFTSPTYTYAVGQSPYPNSRYGTITAKGGTQPSGVTVHSASKPFAITSTQPQKIAVLPPLNSSGQLRNVPKNTYHVRVDMGLLCLAGQPYEIGSIDIEMKIPAGADLADPDNVKAMIICSAGAIAQLVPGAVDTALSGTG